MYITKLELVILLLVFWAPIFLLSKVVQWRFIRKVAVSVRVSIRLAILTCLIIGEMALSFLILISPLHKYFLNLHGVPGLEIGSSLLQAAFIGAALVTLLVYLGREVLEKRNTGNAR